MRSIRMLLAATLLSLGAVMWWGCEDEGEEQLDLGAGDGGLDLAVPDLTAVGTARLRVAHLSPDKGPIDVCLAPHASAVFQGPLLKPLGIPISGLPYGQVSTYLSVAAGQYDVRVVDGAATSCAVGLGVDATNLPALTADSSVTMAALGFVEVPDGGMNPFRIKVFVDTSVPDPNEVKLRFIHAAADVPPVDVGTGAGPDFTKLFDNVAFSSFGTATNPASDPNGFVALTVPSSPPTLTLRLHGMTSDALSVMLAQIPAGGSIVSLFAIGNLAGAPQPLKALLCQDLASPSGGIASCTLLP